MEKYQKEKKLPGIDLDILQYPFDEKILSSLIHSVPFSVYAKNTDGQFIFANLNYCQNLDKPLKEILGKTDFDLHPTEFAEKYLADDSMIMNSKKTRMIEESWQSIGGITQYVQVVKTPLFDSLQPEKVMGTLGVFWDITEKKQAELQIEEERAFLRKLIDSIPAFIYVKDLEGNFLVANQALAEFMGAGSQEELIGKSDFDFYPKETAELFAREEKKLIKTKIPCEDLVEQFTFKGEKYWVNTTKSLLKNRKKETFGIVGVGHDITQIKLIENQLKESEERYAAVVNQMVEGIFLVDPVTKHVLDANASFCKMLGYLPEELQHLKVYDFVLSDQQKIDHHMEKITESNQNFTAERKYRHKDGDILEVEVSAILITFAGRKAMLVVIRDISKKKAAEEEKERLKEELRQAQKFEALGTLAGGVAHDLNNILSGIVSYPELIINKLSPESELIKPLSTIKDSGRRAATVVADLLTIARSAASTKEVHDLNTIVKEYLDSPEYRQTVSHKMYITVQSYLNAEASTLLCSPVHIKKCLMNLVSNASEALEETGSITIETSNQQINKEDGTDTGLEEGIYILLQIKDTGHGISSQDQERIFEPFYTKKEMGRSGTGLGLTVVWNTVMDHGGTISVESGSTGTCFNLYLPYHWNAPVIKDKIGDPIEKSQNHEHILIVDDQEMLQDIASQMLRELGYKTSAVSSGEEAIEFVQKTPVDLLLIDMLMDPGINGRVTFEKILTSYPDCKALIVSGYSEDDEVQKALNLGACEFVQKPYSMSILSQAVKRALLK